MHNWRKGCFGLQYKIRIYGIYHFSDYNLISPMIMESYRADLYRFRAPSYTDEGKSTLHIQSKVLKKTWCNCSPFTSKLLVASEIQKKISSAHLVFGAKGEDMDHQTLLWAHYSLQKARTFPGSQEQIKKDDPDFKFLPMESISFPRNGWSLATLEQLPTQIESFQIFKA